MDFLPYVSWIVPEQPGEDNMVKVVNTHACDTSRGKVT